MNNEPRFQRAENPDNERLPDKFVGHFRLLRDWRKREQIAQRRINTLQDLIDKDSVPRAFQRAMITPAVPEFTPTLTLEWHHIHHEYTVALTKTLITYWQDRLQNTTTEAEKIETQIKGETSTEVYELMKKKVATQIAPKPPAQPWIPNERRTKRKIDSTNEDLSEDNRNPVI